MGEPGKSGAPGSGAAAVTVPGEAASGTHNRQSSGGVGHVGSGTHSGGGAQPGGGTGQPGGGLNR